MAGSFPYTEIVSSRSGYTKVRLTNGDVVEYGGSRGYRNNNPGNLTSDSKSQRILNKYKPYGAMGYDYGGNLIFSDMQGGFNAQKALVTGTYKDYSIGGMLNKYAPPGAANDPNGTNASYPGYMEKQGWNLDTKISDLSPEEQNQLIADMIRKENSTSDANKILDEVDLGDTSNVQKGGQSGFSTPEDDGEDGQNSNTDNQRSGSVTPRNDKVVPTDDFGFKNYSKNQYYNESGINKAARGEWEPKLKVGGGPLGKNLFPTSANPRYPYNNVTETSSGHRIELDDTPGEERITTVHAVGSGMEFHADGTVVLNSYDKTIQVVGDDFTVYVRGNGDITYEGDLSMHVRGDMKVKVDNNYTLEVGGKIIERAIEGRSEVVEGDKVSTVIGNMSETITNSATRTTLGDNTQVVKGDMNFWAEGDAEYLTKGNQHFSSEESMTSASPVINATALNMNLTAPSGHFGGSGVIAHGFAFKGYAQGLWNNITIASAYTPDANTAQDTLFLSEKGIYDVDIDPGNKIKQSLDLRETTSIGQNTSSTTDNATSFNLVE